MTVRCWEEEGAGVTVVVTVWEVSGGNGPAEVSPLAQVCRPRPGLLQSDHSNSSYLLTPAQNIPTAGLLTMNVMLTVTVTMAETMKVTVTLM